MVAGGLNLPAIDMNDPLVKHMLQTRREHAKQQKKDYSHVFTPKSTFDLIRLSCIVVAIELAYSAETAFVSPILLQIGVEHKHMTMVWGLSPLLGFFMSPLLGSISDRCRSSLGRRRPLMIGLSMGIILGLILVPYGKSIGTLLGDQTSGSDDVSTMETNSTLNYTIDPKIVETTFAHHIFAFFFTILGTILLDFNADTCQTPSRAYLLDVCLPSDHAKAMSAFSIMAGLGGTVGYALGAIDWDSTQIGLFFGGNYQTVFFIVLVVFILCFMVTVTSFREIPLDLIEHDQFLRPLSAASIRKEMKNRKNDFIYYIKEATALELKLSSMTTTNEKYAYIADDIKSNNNNNGAIDPILLNGIKKGSKSLNSIPLNESHLEDEEAKVSLSTYLKSIIFMPKSMRILSLTNLLCHMAHLSYCLYFTDFVGEAVFGGDPSALPGSTKADLYNQGVRFGCWGLCIYAFSCSVYSTLIGKFIHWTSTKVVYAGGILVYATGMLILAIWPSKIGVLVLSIPAGVIYSSLFTMPFILIAKYHSQGCFKIRLGENVPLKQSRGLGTDIAIISSMVFIGQLIVSLSMGSIIALIGSTSATLYFACAAAVLASISALNVLYID